jgi:SAM-dependent methyltransferase
MSSPIYHQYVRWYPLLDPVEDHAGDGEYYADVLRRAARGPVDSLLELGSGAGNNAASLKRFFANTLVDLSSEMLALSQAQNPECAHALGDMRTVRLDQTFDAVLIHDAIVYMIDEADLRAALTTAFVHLRPGGAAIFAPDVVRDHFVELEEYHEGDDGSLHLRGFSWAYDPDPSDSTYTVDYMLMFRDGSEVEVAHDRHLEGLFSVEVWRRILAEVGFDVDEEPRDVGGLEGYWPFVFVGRRPEDEG